MNTSGALQVICPACEAINRVAAEKLADQPVCGKCRAVLLDGAVVNASDANFSRHIQKSSLPLVVDFWAPWCGPCQSFAPVFAEVAGEQTRRARFIKVDTEANPRTAAQYQIRSIPTLMLFYQGREVARLSGALPKLQFQQWLAQQLASLPSG
ncbi:thioredoxin TrxC [Spongiibacter sp.]|uniref:thioredoxin TrxC n=1 Tax=Spongiibacter sp. TaxID=2024860 RepID=UPI0035623BE2